MVDSNGNLNFTVNGKELRLRVVGIKSIRKEHNFGNSRLHIEYINGATNDCSGSHDFIELCDLVVQSALASYTAGHDAGYSEGLQIGYDKGYVAAAEKYMD